MKTRSFSLTTLAAFFGASCIAHSATIYEESVSGDLSGVFSSTTPLSLSLGANTVIGEIGSNGNTGATNGSDADYFTVDVAVGQTLISINVDSYTFSPGDPGSSFLGYVAGNEFLGQGSSDIDGFKLFNAGSGEIIDDLGSPAGLGAGTYSFWLQETSSNTVDYQLTFTVIPEPSLTVLSVLGLGFVAARRRR